MGNIPLYKGKKMQNTLSLVTLPIGNSADITYRAKDELEKAKLIYAEDTRFSKSFAKKLKSITQIKI